MKVFPPRKCRIVIANEQPFDQMYANVFRRYADEMEVLTATTAAGVLGHLNDPAGWPDAVIMEQFLAYGELAGAAVLSPDTDPDMQSTGTHMFSYIRQRERDQEALMPAWLVLMTTQPLLTNRRMHNLARQIIGDYGGIFVEPINPHLLEARVCGALGVACRVPSVLLK